MQYAYGMAIIVDQRCRGVLHTPAMPAVAATTAPPAMATQGMRAFS
jgi:hypothetical protein